MSVFAIRCLFNMNLSHDHCPRVTKAQLWLVGSVPLTESTETLLSWRQPLWPLCALGSKTGVPVKCLPERTLPSAAASSYSHNSCTELAFSSSPGPCLQAGWEMWSSVVSVLHFASLSLTHCAQAAHVWSQPLTRCCLVPKTFWVCVLTPNTNSSPSR